MLYCACVKWTKAVRILTHEQRMCHSIKRKSLLCELIAVDGYMMNTLIMELLDDNNNDWPLV